MDNEINEAESFVREFEKNRTGSYPEKMSNNGPGYDFRSCDRHIEVKGAKKKGKSWLQLTANETRTMRSDPNYYLYLVEGDFDEEGEKIELYIIPQKDLLEMSQVKEHARLTRLSNQEKRKEWISSNDIGCATQKNE